jgi:hypothetical protein
MRMFYRFMPAAFCLIILSSFTLEAQDTIRVHPGHKNQNILERIDFGGYLGAQFGAVTAINISPMASYRITNSLYAGLGLTYQYYKDTRYTPDYSASSYGGSIFARYFIWRDLFAHVEYAPLYMNYYYDDGTGNQNLIKDAIWVHDLMIGGGYRQWIGDKAFMSLMLLWNVNESIYSPYRNPIIRIGFGVGL